MGFCLALFWTAILLLPTLTCLSLLPGDECMEAIRVEVEDLLILFPVELIVMSRAEEKELNFITVTRARNIADICEE